MPGRKGKMLTKKEIEQVLKKLYHMYPEATSELNYRTPFELLISTILAAQCTDVRVNQVTSTLYKQYNTPEAFLTLTEEALGEKIRSCGFYKSKARNILYTCKILVEKYGGRVPDTREELMALPGVGRKTANVVISNAFGKAAIAVDTHVFRVSNRIGLAHSDNVDETERQLMQNIPEEQWSDAHHWLIYHGRRICKARKPLCEKCPLTEECLYYKELAGRIL
ncbi:endonuclease III [Thermotalea metallivorans]|uniref:Endonuclease III n=1 Tax=Thermotalea metallivorans TaxID=520762 RepID=A0A140LEF8_9FIRM|nr:endonuclease III [Thermotalea metallivorans]KXG78933.1 Endonuclease III [Thermotalea metallivorans]